MGGFDKIGSATATGGKGKYFNEGVYLCECDKAQYQESRRRGKPSFVGIESSILLVLRSYEAGRLSSVNGEPMPASNVAGEKCFHYNPEDSEMFLDNVKGFLTAAVPVTQEVLDNPETKEDLGLDPSADPNKVWAKLSETVLMGDGKWLSGHKYIVTCTEIPKRNGDPFNLVSYEEATPAALAKYGLTDEQIATYLDTDES